LPVISKTSNKTHNAVIVEMGSHILNKIWKENEINDKYSKMWELFNGEVESMVRGFIKIIETWQFGLSFNIISNVFFCFGQKNFFVGFMNF
jgi:hypothetical protein